ncbi:MAG: hypothetical protein EAZ85_03675 [Bacteroidetes bacterium]|nr:MAG: hypothetical protein EAZ85_03675 [Bacteroidota bacterium]TAG89584.1 MAG: hypothetical protein EAZ20_06160 [Bacteroidota bacterium]
MEINLIIDDNKASFFLELLKNLDFVKDITLSKKLSEVENTLSDTEQEIWQGIKEGLEDARKGKIRPAKQFLEEMKLV